MEPSQPINEIAKALAAAQAEMKPAKKSGFNPHFKSHFSTLQDIHDACLHILNKNGIAVSQVTGFYEGQKTVKTILMHSSGQFISALYPIEPTQNTPQAAGSSLSYARRYSLAAIVGVASEDDDGEAASAAPKTEAAHKTPIPAAVVESKESRLGPKPSEAQIKRLFAIAHKNGWGNADILKYLGEKLGVESTAELYWSQYEKFVQFIEAYPKRAEVT